MLGVAALTPAAAQAQQECGFCSDYYDLSVGDWYHYFGSSGAMLSCSPGSLGCHYGEPGAWGFCATYHGECDGGPFEEDVEDMATAVETGDGARLANLVTAFRGHVTVNNVTATISVRACDGRVSAQLAVPPPLLAHLSL